MGCCSSYHTPTAYSWGEGVDGSLGDYQRRDHYTPFPFPIRGLPMTYGEQAEKLFSVRPSPVRARRCHMHVLRCRSLHADNTRLHNTK